MKRPSGAELVLSDTGIWVRSIVSVVLLLIGLILLGRGQLFGLVFLAAVAWYMFEIVRRVALLRALGARGVMTEGHLMHENEPWGETDWRSAEYEFHALGRAYQHHVVSFMVSPRSSHGTVVGIIFDPVDPTRAVVRGRFDGVEAPR